MVSGAMSSTWTSKSHSKARPGVIVTHPNRSKPVVQTTRATVVLLLLASVALILIVTIGGWGTLQGDIPILLAYAAVYLVMAYYATRWSRGVLPVAAVLALLLAIFALVAAPSWFERDKPGFAEPNLNASMLGVITLVIVPVQMLLIAFSMRGFQQGWNVELEQLDPRAGGTLPHSA
jgi:Na+/H+ antiporter NhaD/arsenite permease-like protein